MKKFVQKIEGLSELMGSISGWLMVALVLLVTADVAGRYLFNTGAVAIQEAEWWLFSMVFLLGAGYTFKHNEHVRVDVVYSLFSKRTQAWIDFVCLLVFFFPLCILIIVTSYPFVLRAYVFQEVSPSPGGLPYFFFIKAMIPFGFVLLFLQGIAQAWHAVEKMRQPKEAKPSSISS